MTHKKVRELLEQCFGNVQKGGIFKVVVDEFVYAYHPYNRRTISSKEQTYVFEFSAKGEQWCICYDGKTPKIYHKNLGVLAAAENTFEEALAKFQDNLRTRHLQEVINQYLYKTNYVHHQLTLWLIL